MILTPNTKGKIQMNSDLKLKIREAILARRKARSSARKKPAIKMATQKVVDEIDVTVMDAATVVDDHPAPQHTKKKSKTKKKKAVKG